MVAQVSVVPEYAKDLTWQESFKVLKNQIYVWTKQYQWLYRLRDKVDLIVKIVTRVVHTVRL